MSALCFASVKNFDMGLPVSEALVPSFQLSWTEDLSTRLSIDLLLAH